jgi:hypothetical protein
MQKALRHSDAPERTLTGVARAVAIRIGSVACLVVLIGCRPAVEPRVVGYFGPTEPLASVVGQINANNSRIPTLWAKGYFEATLVDARSKTQFVNGDAVLLLRKPGEFRMVGRKDVAGQVFELGTTQREYWMIVRPEADTMWWGTYDRLAQANPGLIPIRPDLLMQVLAVGDIDSDLLREPAPFLRFNSDADAYMLVWVERGDGRFVAQREVWYDRATLLPKLVLLFDGNGRIVVRAYLSEHREVSESGGKIAGRYQLFFPDSGTRLDLKLSEAKLSQNGVPRAGSIAFPGENAGVSNIVRVDEEPAR